MATLDDKQRNFVSRTIEAVDQFMIAYEELQEIRTEYDALDYGNTLTAAAFAGENQHVDLVDLVAVITSQAAIETTLAAGHRTNLLKVRR